MSNKLQITHIEAILLLTAFAAGTVDVISFATLGGVFASAMTGNFALLAYYVAQSDSQSAMGSVIALSGFVVGCAVGVLQRRGRPQQQALSLLLVSESGLLLFFAIYALWTPHVLHGRSAVRPAGDDHRRMGPDRLSAGGGPPDQIRVVLLIPHAPSIETF